MVNFKSKYGSKSKQLSQTAICRKERKKKELQHNKVRLRAFLLIKTNERVTFGLKNEYTSRIIKNYRL